MPDLPQTRQELAEWCLRKLGEPVIQVNVDEDQVCDRITEALAYFQEYHFDGVEEIWMKHQVTASEMRFDSALTDESVQYELVTGQTSGAIAKLYDQAEDNLSIRFITEEGAFQDGEDVIFEQSGITATLAATDAITIGDIDNKYIPVGDEILSVIEVLPFNSSFYYGSGMFDVRYQWAMHNMYNMINSDLITYDMFKKHLALWQFEFEGIKNVKHNRKTDKIYLDIDWSVDLIDTNLIFKVQRVLDPKEYPEIYSDFFVREYAYLLIKKQWAQNLSKYEGVQLPSGITLNASKMMEEAITELEKLEERLQKEFQMPINFFVG
jgi:hypothetical protein